MAIDELIVPEDFTIRITIKREGQEDLTIEENGLDLKFDLIMSQRNVPPNDARWGFMAAYLTTRWKEQLGDLVISRDTALAIWGKCNKKADALKKNS
jgi:hypothetical protein